MPPQKLHRGRGDLLPWPSQRMIGEVLLLHLICERAVGHYQQKACHGILGK